MSLQETIGEDRYAVITEQGFVGSVYATSPAIAKTRALYSLNRELYQVKFKFIVTRNIFHRPLFGVQDAA